MNFQGHIFLPYYRTTYSSAVVRGKENTFLFRFDSIDEKQQKSDLTKILDHLFITSDFVYQYAKKKVYGYKSLNVPTAKLFSNPLVAPC